MIKMKKEVYQRMMDTLGKHPPETGGIFAMDEDTITAYYFDEEAQVSFSSYRPSRRVIEEIGRWRKNGLCFGGFIHSHPGAGTKLSPRDVVFARELIQKNNLQSTIMAIFNRDAIYLYAVDKEGNVMDIPWMTEE